MPGTSGHRVVTPPVGKPAGRDRGDDLEVAVRVGRAPPERALDQGRCTARPGGERAHGVPLDVRRSVVVDQAIAEPSDRFEVAGGAVGALYERHVIGEAGTEIGRRRPGES